MITSEQIRAARALLGWSAADAGVRAGITRQTIQRLESFNGIPPSRSKTLANVQAAFETAGIEFIGTPDEGPGVRFWGKLATDRSAR